MSLIKIVAGAAAVAVGALAIIHIREEKDLKKRSDEERSNKEAVRRNREEFENFTRQQQQANSMFHHGA